MGAGAVLVLARGYGGSGARLEVNRCVGCVQSILARASIMGTGPCVGVTVGVANKPVFLFWVSAFIAVQELGKGLLAGHEIVGGGQANADFQCALAGNAVEVALCQNAQRLAEVRKQGVADLGRYLQPCGIFLMAASCVHYLRQLGGQVSGIETEALVARL